MRKIAKDSRHRKIRKKISGNANRPRLSVYRSNKHIYAQIIDDNAGKTLVFVSDKGQDGNKQEKAYNVGKVLAQIAIKKKVKKIVFDRGGFLFHGRVAQVAKGAREGGLEF